MEKQINVRPFADKNIKKAGKLFPVRCRKKSTFGFSAEGAKGSVSLSAELISR